ncbi:MAG: choice-of-anchor B family protein [Planctomycetes bacterium]|nr:choice-of-anchor B family protein [Planctomycetota bacterium]
MPTTTITIDVSNLSNPHEVGRFTNGNSSIGHNLYVKGNLIFEASYRAGIRVYDATNPLAPTEIAYFDTWPEDDLPNFNGLWNNYPYLPSGTIIGSDIEKGLFVWRLGTAPLAFSYPNGQPSLISPEGGSFVVHIAEQGGGQLEAGTAMLHYDGGAGVVDVPLVSRGAGNFDATFPSLPCGATVRYWFTARSTSGSTITDPAGAPSAGSFTLTIGLCRFVSFSDDMEVDRGWVVGAVDDNALTGIWTRVDPVGTGAQPEDDHTAGAATRCWVTGQGGVGGGIGDADVDGGKTTLRTPQLNLAGLHDPLVSYWRWYSNTGGGSPNADVFTVDVSADDGATWTNVETVGPTGPDTSGGWVAHEFRVAAFVTPTSRVRVRFVASDAGAGSIIEAAVDDFQVTDLVCADCNGNGIDDATDIARGTSLDANGDSIPDECQNLVLSGPVPGQAGVVNTVTVSGATPGAGVQFFTGNAAGSTVAPGCPSTFLGIASAHPRRTLTANASGQVTASTMIRPGFSGRTILVQAIELTDCRLTNLVTHTFP